MAEPVLIMEEAAPGQVRYLPARISWLSALADEFKLSRAELRFAEAFYRTASIKRAAQKWP